MARFWQSVLDSPPNKAKFGSKNDFFNNGNNSLSDIRSSSTEKILSFKSSNTMTSCPICLANGSTVKMDRVYGL